VIHRSGEPLRVFFGHHRCATTSTAGLNETVCRELGLRHRVLHSLYGLDDPGRWIAAEGVEFLSYTNADPARIGELGELRGFHIIRDPRDLCVSNYFSDLLSHNLDEEWVELAERRRHLNEVSRDEGLHFEIDSLGWLFERMAAWEDRADVFEVRLEEIMANPYQVYLDVFTFLGLLDDVVGRRERLVREATIVAGRVLGARSPRPLRDRRRHALMPERLLGIVYERSFSRLAGGRRPGEEDVTSHHRKGVAGDWRNHFTDAHVERFKELYNPVLVRLGYETDDRWSLRPTVGRS
jgi:Sulfotransferase domain